MKWCYWENKNYIRHLLGDDDTNAREVLQSIQWNSVERPYPITCDTLNKIKSTINKTGALSKLVLENNSTKRRNINRLFF